MSHQHNADSDLYADYMFRDVCVCIDLFCPDKRFIRSKSANDILKSPRDPGEDLSNCYEHVAMLRANSKM